MSRGLLFIIPLLWIMPKLFGINGIWLVMPVAEVLTAIIVFTMNRMKHPVPINMAGEKEVIYGENPLSK